MNPLLDWYIDGGISTSGKLISGLMNTHSSISRAQASKSNITSGNFI